MAGQPQADIGSVGLIELRGIDTVPDVERRGRPRTLFWPWAAANISALPVSYGAFVVGLGLSWWQAIAAVIAGSVLSFLLVGLVALAGRTGGAPTMTLGRAAFGYHGNKLPTVISYLSLVGWETISMVLAALTTRSVLSRLNLGWSPTSTLLVGFVLTAAGTITLGIYGYHIIMRAQKVITILLAVVSIGYLVIIGTKLHLASGGPPNGSLGLFIGGVTLVATANGLGWTNSGADYSRYLPRDSSARAVVGWTAFGGALPPTILMLFGIALTAADPRVIGAVSTDPIGALAAQLPTWFLWPFLLSVLISVIGAAVIDLYSSGINLQALGLRVARPVAVSIDSVLMIVGGVYIIFIAPSFYAPFQAFLTVFGVGTAAWTGIFITDLMMYRRDGYVMADIYRPAGVYGRVNLAGVISLVVSLMVGFGLITSADPTVAAWVGYLLTPTARTGSIGASNIGVIVALVLAAGLYAALSATGIGQQATSERRVASASLRDQG